MTHRTEIRQIAPSTWVGTCSCGWLGKDQPTANGARMEQSVHYISERRKELDGPIVAPPRKP